jgi:hypothetical protein
MSSEFGGRVERSSTDLALEPAYPSNIGLGSVGCEILCFLADELLALGSVELPELDFGEETLRPNHLEGLERN